MLRTLRLVDSRSCCACLLCSSIYEPVVTVCFVRPFTRQSSLFGLFVHLRASRHCLVCSSIYEPVVTGLFVHLRASRHCLVCWASHQPAVMVYPLLVWSVRLHVDELDQQTREPMSTRKRSHKPLYLSACQVRVRLPYRLYRT